MGEVTPPNPRRKLANRLLGHAVIAVSQETELGIGGGARRREDKSAAVARARTAVGGDEKTI